jgi:hypothetical protein
MSVSCDKLTTLIDFNWFHASMKASIDKPLIRWLADVTQLANIINVCTCWQSSTDQGMKIIWVFGYIVGVLRD